MTNSLKLDLACGNNKQKGFIGVDITKKGTQADIEHNLLQLPWPFKDNSVDEVFCSHYLEHIPHGNGSNDPFFDFFNELWRVLKLSATATFIFPYYSSVRAIQDPTHMRSIAEPTFFYLSKKWRVINKLSHYPIKTNFEVIKMDHAISEEYVGKAQDTVSYAAMHFLNVVNDLQVVIKKLKK